MGTRKIISDPEVNFETFWETFNNRYPFFELRKVNWENQYEIFRPRVTSTTSDVELFDIMCDMIRPLNDGHIELFAKNVGGKKRYFNPELQPKFWQEFEPKKIKKLFKTTAATLTAHGFGKPKKTAAWMMRYCRSKTFGYIRILELEGIGKRKLAKALDQISDDFPELCGIIIDIRNNPGGDDSTALQIINRFCDRKRVAFHRQTKIGPRPDDLTDLKTWHMAPAGDVQFTGPITVLTCDAVFSGGEAFALAIRELPHVTIIGDSTNGILSYQLERKLPNGWRYCLSYQIYLSADMICYEGIGVPADISLRNSLEDLQRGVDPLIVRALEVMKGHEAKAIGL